MNNAPKGIRLHIGIFGRRNVGKSSLLNALTHQEVSIVSEVAGTTTDPVEKPMEILPIGPILFIDTAGVDDVGALGELRIERTRKIFDRTDIGIVVCESDGWGEFEEAIVRELSGRNAAAIVVFNKADLASPDPAAIESLKSRNIPFFKTAASAGGGIKELIEGLIHFVPDDFLKPPPLIGDLLRPGDLAVLVVPIDLEAPKGRLILPQVQTLRDVLDHDAYAVVVKERELRDALGRFNRPPAIVVTDSQAFLKVAADTPDSVMMTSFSILFARNKGDLREFAQGAQAIDSLKSGDRVLIAEACTHHPIADDIGRVKIPRWITQYVGGEIHVDYVQGHDFPDDLSPYRLVVTCGSCMVNRKEVLARILKCKNQGVPITNYGLTIAFCLGIFQRAVRPFHLDLA